MIHDAIKHARQIAASLNVKRVWKRHALYQSWQMCPYKPTIAAKHFQKNLYEYIEVGLSLKAQAYFNISA